MNTDGIKYKVFFRISNTSTKLYRKYVIPTWYSQNRLLLFFFKKWQKNDPRKVALEKVA